MNANECRFGGRVEDPGVWLILPGIPPPSPSNAWSKQRSTADWWNTPHLRFQRRPTRGQRAARINRTVPNLPHHPVHRRRTDSQQRAQRRRLVQVITFHHHPLRVRFHHFANPQTCLIVSHCVVSAGIVVASVIPVCIEVSHFVPLYRTFISTLILAFPSPAHTRRASRTIAKSLDTRSW